MASNRVDTFDLAVIGGGSGGLVAAIVAHKLCLKTALIEGRFFGGDCLNFGCVPSKSLIASSRAAALMREANRFGIESIEPRLHWDRITGRIAAIQDHIREHETASYFREMGLSVYEAHATFVDPHTLRVNDQTVTANKIVIATGSSPVVPPIDGLKEAGYITNEDVFTLKTQPKRLTVIGGGPIGVEMAQAFARLGTNVTLIESADCVLSREDDDMSAIVCDALKRDGVDLRMNCTAASVSVHNGEKRISLEYRGEHDEIAADEIFVAVGRKPSIDGLKLDVAGINHDRRGICVNKRMQTSVRHIYAVGDCAGGPMFTHAASLEASVAIRNIVFKLPAKVSYRAFGWCTYTEPELASVGFNEKRAQADEIDYSVAEAKFADNDRALCESSTAGKIKVLYQRGWRKKIIGAQIVGPHAGELIHEYVLAISRGMTMGQLAGPTHIYPTLSEINRRVAINHLAESFFSDRTRRILRLLFRYRGAAG
ncbi:MAG: FAD-dependent oxidoreductase [Planctomycetes bacterium]|nr:FAD-dependent oxidoreductase [Planctomycetota bacterium]